MRLAGQMKGGYFPAPPEAIAHVLKRLRFEGDSPAFLDPCAGRGDAIAQLAEALGCPADRVWTVELDSERAGACKTRFPNALGPASFLGTRVSSGSFGFAWVNPPFDDELGGGQREELRFLAHVTPALKTGGVLALCCPAKVGDDWRVRDYLAEHYHLVTELTFPEEVRRFEECVILGVKRDKPIPKARDEDVPWMAEEGHVYHIPNANGPARFAKVEPTPQELADLLAASPLRKLLDPPVKGKSLPPPLSLGRGHRALLLASGQLDGIVRPAQGEAFCIRGTSVKEKYISNEEETVDSEGAEVTKTTYSERMVLTVRVATASGRLVTLKA